MNVIIITKPIGGYDWESQRKDSDLSKPGNVKWLMSHIKWAAKNRLEISIVPN